MSFISAAVRTMQSLMTHGWNQHLMKTVTPIVKKVVETHKKVPKLSADDYKRSIQQYTPEELYYSGTKAPDPSVSTVRAVDTLRLELEQVKPSAAPSSMTADYASKSTDTSCFHLTTHLDTAQSFGTQGVYVMRKSVVEKHVTPSPNPGLGELVGVRGLEQSSLLGWIHPEDYQVTLQIWRNARGKTVPTVSALKRYPRR